MVIAIVVSVIRAIKERSKEFIQKIKQIRSKAITVQICYRNM